MRAITKCIVSAAMLAATLVVSAPAPSTAATQHIPNGLSDFMGGVLPPPGIYWLNYAAYIQKDKLRDKDGDEALGPSGKALDFKAGVWVDALRFVWMTPYKILGADYGMQVILPVYAADVKVEDDTAGTLVDSDASGLGDITINPIILSWHLSPKLHIGAGLDIACPTGNYDKDEAASTILNKNHFTFEPLVAVSYWEKDGLDLSVKIMYDFHTKNTDPAGGDELKPGQEFHFDWAASYAIMSEDWRAGLTGYYYTQTTKDDLDGVEDDISSIASIGAAVKYWPKMGPLSFTAKYMKEFGGKNIPEGQNFWLNFVWAL